MALKPQIEAIIYAAEEPVTIEQMAVVLKDAVLAEGGFEEGLDPKALDAEVKKRVKAAVEEVAADYDNASRGMEIRQVAGGWRMGTKPEHHDVVRHFVKSLKPPIKLSLPALETLAVIAYKQPVTAPEISEIRGVDTSGVLATLLDRKLITTAGRKQVIGRPIMYKTSKDFLLRFGLKDVAELPSLEEFEKLAGDGQSDMFEEKSPGAPVEGEGGEAASPSLAPGQETSQSSEPASDFPQQELDSSKVPEPQS
jgi:segregation and condensation protein B